MNITSIPPPTAALLARATDYRLVELVIDAFDDGFVIDVQVCRREDGAFLLDVLVLEGDRIDRDVEFLLGPLTDTEEDVGAAVLYVWARTIETRVTRNRARVERAMAEGRS